MNFLEIGFFKDIAENVGGVVFDALRSLCYWLDTIIYNLIIYLYNWFMMLCQSRILDNAAIQKISDRFGLILGVFMFFNVAIAFLKMILDPDKINDKEIGMGAIVKKVLLVVVMLGMSNIVFEAAFDFQRVLLGYNKSGTNVIQNLLSPYSVSSKDFGTSLSLNLFSAFYNIDSSLDDSSNTDVLDCMTYLAVLKNSIVASRNFDFGYSCLNTKTEVTLANSGGQTSSIYVMHFESFLSVAVGCFVVYTLFMYCIKVGVRMVQLAFLEILSPMAIISYLSPKKDTMFSRWGKAYISTYVDVFIRVAIINLVVYLIAVVMEGWQGGTGAFWESFSNSNLTATSRMFLGVIIILSLLTFAKRAPDLLKSILPSTDGGSGLGFGLGKKDNEFGFGLLGGIGAKGAGVLGGAVGGLVGGAVGGGVIGALGGVFRGGFGGLKNKKLGDALKSASGAFDSQKSAALRTQQRIDAGGSRFVMPGVQRRVAALDKAKSAIEARSNLAKSTSDNVGAIHDRAVKQMNDGKFSSDNVMARNITKQKIDALDEQAKNMSVSDFIQKVDQSDFTNNGVLDVDSYNEAVRRSYESAERAYDQAQRDFATQRESLQVEYNDYEKAAINDFVVAKREDDAVIAANIAQIEDSLSHNTTGATFEGGTSDWYALDDLDRSAKSISNQSILDLSENKRLGERDRANAQYSGKK